MSLLELMQGGEHSGYGRRQRAQQGGQSEDGVCEHERCQLEERWSYSEKQVGGIDDGERYGAVGLVRVANLAVHAAGKTDRLTTALKSLSQAATGSEPQKIENPQAES